MKLDALLRDIDNRLGSLDDDSLPLDDEPLSLDDEPLPSDDEPLPLVKRDSVMASEYLKRLVDTARDKGFGVDIKWDVIKRNTALIVRNAGLYPLWTFHAIKTDIIRSSSKTWSIYINLISEIAAFIVNNELVWTCIIKNDSGREESLQFISSYDCGT